MSTTTVQVRSRKRWSFHSTRVRGVAAPQSDGGAAAYLREFWFPGNAASSEERWRVRSWGVANLLLAQLAFRSILALFARISPLLPAHAGLHSGRGIGFLFAVLFTLFCQREGLYRQYLGKPGRRETVALVKSAIWAALGVGGAVLAVGGASGVVAVMVMTAAGLHCGVLAGLMQWKAHLGQRGTGTEELARRVVIAGTGRSAVALAAQLKKDARLGRQFEGFVSDFPDEGVPTLGGVRDLERLVQSHFLDEIIVCRSGPRCATSR